jgi:hypothetical protein
MSDKELLELAAKAAGAIKGLNGYMEPCLFIGRSEVGINWNPLTDDGDALRLAVKLGLNPRPCALDGTAECSGMYEVHHFGEVCDQYAAMRRAIVRAAAEIGKES